jgi:hypothetical protein
MKKIIIVLLLLSPTLLLSQVYDGITQPTEFRWWMPVSFSLEKGNDPVAAPFAGYKYTATDWLSFTPVLQYNLNSESVKPMLWINVNYNKTYWLLFRSIYDAKAEQFSETISGTVKLPMEFMADFTWSNVYSNGEFFENDRLQFLVGYDYGLFVLNAGYVAVNKSGFVSNLRVRVTKLAWLQFKYDSGTNTFAVSTAIHY